jgi:hypothetical protein
MSTIYHQVGIKASLHDVYKAISSTEGVTGWWTATSGDSDVGGELEFSFDDHIVKVKVTANVEDRYVEWTVGGDAGEWLDTCIRFDLEQLEDQVMINFQHTGWKAETPFLAHCCTKWGVFMLSLKDYLETGTGKPFPHDIHINHTVFN